MSLVIAVKNAKKLLGYRRPLLLKECLTLLEDKSHVFGAGRQLSPVDRVSELGEVMFITYGKSARGFHLSYKKDEEAYHIRVPIPSSLGDWEVAARFAKALAESLKTDLTIDGFPDYNRHNALDFPYQKLLDNHLREIKDNLSQQYSLFLVEGFNRQVSFDEKLMTAICQAESPSLAFSQLLHRLQYLDAYSAKQRFYQRSGSEAILGVYVLTQGCETILPFKPSVELAQMGEVTDEQVSEWQLNLVGHHGDGNKQEDYFTMGTVAYDDFISRLSTDKYEFIDATHIIVAPHTQEELAVLLTT